MATSSDFEISSPLPRAPPPSPECPTHQTDLGQFDFTAALLSNNKPRSHGPSPASSRGNSGPASPSWNGSGSYSGHSPFFYPSPENHSPSPSRSVGLSTNDFLLPGNLTEPVSSSLGTSSNGLSVSLPVNGHAPFGHSHFLPFGDVSDETGERKRKISLKRPHAEQDQMWYSTSYEKKVRSDERERESRTFNQSYPQQRPRASTYNGPLTLHSSSRTHRLSNDLNQLSLVGPASGQMGVVPPVTTYQLLSGSQVNAYSSHDSHVTPQSMQTIGFVMEGGGSNAPDDQMDTDTKISITRADTIEHSNEMDCSYEGPCSGLFNGHSNRSPFSFNLDTHLHPNYNGVSSTLGCNYGHYLDSPSNGGNPFYHTDVSSFSKSL